MTTLCSVRPWKCGAIINTLLRMPQSANLSRVASQLSKIFDARFCLMRARYHYTGNCVLPASVGHGAWESCMNLPVLEPGSDEDFASTPKSHVPHLLFWRNLIMLHFLGSNIVSIIVNDCIFPGTKKHFLSWGDGAVVCAFPTLLHGIAPRQLQCLLEISPRSHIMKSHLYLLPFIFCVCLCHDMLTWRSLGLALCPLLSTLG